ncbi:PEP-CTERM sorting domain-containing protein [Duganella sp. HH105]|uniref:PEP-CTERM sorting domain-containing protein n=1 Tax=Duganella sp. HH105 TaxID=1781067 RepID=UPI000877E072|nr:PEP-CTERM sorting domain-containing protein [Duganella sp. HH105]OEZ55675.1 PEP-CTERM motif protein [Duganella sp. HH105]
MKIKGRYIPAIGVVLGFALAAISPLSAAGSVSTGVAITNVQFKVGDIDGYPGQINLGKQRTWMSAGSELASLHDTQSYDDLRAATASVSSSTAKNWTTHSGVAGEIQAYSEASGRDQGGTSSIQEQYFALTPHSSISISGHISGFVESSAGMPDASADSHVRIYLLNGDDELAGVEMDIGLSYLSPYSATYSKDFILTYENHTDFGMSMLWSSVAHTYASNKWYPTNPVPEPESYAMMAAGLVLLGVVARRRKQGKA